jgi:hypothetical protein
MDKDKWIIEGKDEHEDAVFEHDEAIERYLKNPDAIIADFTGHRFLFKVTSGYITDDSIQAVEAIIRDMAIDYEYPLHGVNVTNDRIEIKVELSVNEAPLECAERFHGRLEQADMETELLYIGTLGKK